MLVTFDRIGRTVGTRADPSETTNRRRRARRLKMENHPQRDLIWQELHARPYVRFSAPAHVFHFAFLTGEETGPASVAQRARLRERLGLATAYETERHAIHAASIAGLGRLVVAWEQHSEFVTRMASIVSRSMCIR